MTHRYTGTVGKRFEGENIPRAHEVQGTASLLVQQCINQIDYNGGWGQACRQLALRDGTVVKAIVLKHRRGFEPIVRVEVFAPQFLTDKQNFFLLPIESGVLEWSMTDPQFPLRVEISGDLAAYASHNAVSKTYIVSLAPGGVIQGAFESRLGVARYYASQVYSTIDMWKNIALWHDVEDIPLVTRNRADPALDASIHSGHMRLLVQALAGAGRRLDQIGIGLTFDYARGENLRGTGLVFDDARGIFWLITIMTNTVVARRMELTAEGTGALQQALDLSPTLDWANNIDCRMLLCFAFNQMSTSEALTVTTPTSTHSGLSEAKALAGTFTAHSWQWSRVKPECAVVLGTSVPGDETYPSHAKTWLALADITFTEDTDGNLGVELSCTVDGPYRFRPNPEFFLLWIPQTIYGIREYLLVEYQRPNHTEAYTVFTDTAPIHAFYTRDTDELTVIKYESWSEIVHETKPTIDRSGAHYRATGTAQTTFYYADGRDGKDITWTGGFTGQSSECGTAKPWLHLEEHYRTVASPHPPVAALPYFPIPTNTPLDSQIKAAKDTYDGAYGAEKNNIAKQIITCARTRTHITRYNYPHEVNDKRLSALVISHYDPTVYFIFSQITESRAKANELIQSSIGAQIESSSGTYSIYFEYWSGIVEHIVTYETPDGWLNGMTVETGMSYSDTSKSGNRHKFVGEVFVDGRRREISRSEWMGVPFHPYERFLTYNYLAPDSYWKPAADCIGYQSCGGVEAISTPGDGWQIGQGYSDAIKSYPSHALFIGGV